VVSFIAIWLFEATIGFSIGLDADIFRDVGCRGFRGGSRLPAHLSQIGAPGTPHGRRRLVAQEVMPKFRQHVTAQAAE
jgi:hypothetical protein